MDYLFRLKTTFFVLLWFCFSNCEVNYQSSENCLIRFFENCDGICCQSFGFVKQENTVQARLERSGASIKCSDNNKIWVKKKKVKLKIICCSLVQMAICVKIKRKLVMSNRPSKRFPPRSNSLHHCKK